MSDRIDITKQDSENIEVTITDENGDPFDLTGKTVTFTVKRYTCDSNTDAIIQKIITTHISPTEGKTIIELSSSDTNVSQGIYVYDVEVTWGSSVKTVIKDIFTVTEDVTDN